MRKGRGPAAESQAVGLRCSAMKAALDEVETCWRALVTRLAELSTPADVDQLRLEMGGALKRAASAAAKLPGSAEDAPDEEEEARAEPASGDGA